MLIGSRYRFRSNIGIEEKSGPYYYSDEQDLQSGIEDYGGKMDFDYRPLPAHTIRFGASGMYKIFRPGMIRQWQQANGETWVDSTNANRRINGTEVDLYAEDDWEVTSRLKVNAGLHFGGFAVDRKFYSSLQPRLSMRYLLPGDWVMKASWSRMTQFLHLLANNTISLPTDLWVPVTQRIKPQHADQFAIGITKNLHDGKYELTAEAYYKNMRNVIEYKDGAGYITSVLNENWEDNIAAGNAQAYGAELLLRKQTGRLTGWIGYTLAWSDRQLDEVNLGRRFPYKYDRRHDLHILGIYKLRRNIELSASWMFQSASPFTVGVGRYAAPDGGPVGYPDLEVVPGRNNLRIAPHHRLDLGVSFIKNKRNGMVRTWNISVLNAYNRVNPAYVTGMFIDRENQNKVKADVTTLVPIMPSISYQLKW